MRVLYGVQGTGNGHLARARSLVPALRAEEIEFDCLFTGRERVEFFDMEAFGDFRCARGFTLAVEKGRLNLAATLRRNNLISFFQDVRALDIRQYDLVITDFEPVTAWAATLKGVPSIGLSHQNAFHYDVPKVKGFSASRMLMRYFAPVDTALGFHWHHFNQPVLPPLIEPHRGRPSIKEKILVYMGFEELGDVVSFLQGFTDFEFYIFAKVPEQRILGNIHIQPISHTQFHRHLEDCGGVISNAGFELASECLALGKKLLVKPLAGQYEQLSNALGLQTLKRATIIESLDRTILEQWLNLPLHTPIPYPDVSRELARWIKRDNRESVAELATSLWNGLSLEYEYDADFGTEILPGMVV